MPAQRVAARVKVWSQEQLNCTDNDIWVIIVGEVGAAAAARHRHQSTGDDPYFGRLNGINVDATGETMRAAADSQQRPKIEGRSREESTWP